MKNKGILTKILAITGTLLVWFPILAPILLTVVAMIARGRFLFDYLMPAELFPSALAGGVLLLWTALRTHSRQKHIGWSLGLVVGWMVGITVIPVVTGLASGEREPVGFWFALVLAILALYSLSLVSLASGGVLLLRDLFKTQQLPIESL